MLNLQFLASLAISSGMQNLLGGAFYSPEIQNYCMAVGLFVPIILNNDALCYFVPFSLGATINTAEGEEHF